MKAFRIFFRSIRDSFKSVTRNFSLSLASSLCVTITLIIVASSLVLAQNIKKVTSRIEDTMNIVVYANSNVTDEDLENINDEIKSIKHVVKTDVFTKAEEKDSLSNYSDTFKTILDYLEENPLLDSFEVYVDDIVNIKEVSKEIAKIPNVESVQYNEGVVEKIISSFDIVEKVTIGIVIALVLVTVFLIGNTIKLTIYSRQNEIGIMRLVGASNKAIELPFVFEGLLIGVVGAIIPICVTIYGYVILYNALDGQIISENYPLVAPYNFVFYVSGVLLLIGCLVGMFGSVKAVRKYLKV